MGEGRFGRGAGAGEGRGQLGVGGLGWDGRGGGRAWTRVDAGSWACIGTLKQSNTAGGEQATWIGVGRGGVRGEIVLSADLARAAMSSHQCWPKVLV